MTEPQAEPSAQALGESLAALAAQVAALRGQVAQINSASTGPGSAATWTSPPASRNSPRPSPTHWTPPRPAAPPLLSGSAWTAQAFDAQLAELRRWADTVLRQHYGGYELRDCWPSHIHAVWELSTLAAAWHHAYGGERPDLGRALEFYDRWLPGTMRRIAAITR